MLVPEINTNEARPPIWVGAKVAQITAINTSQNEEIKEDDQRRSKDMGIQNYTWLKEASLLLY
jgi:hypothetical protein